MGFLTEHCTLSYYTEETFHRCQPFTCGKDDDMDEFFRKDVFDYNEFLMSKAYCFRLKEDLTQIVCVFTLSNDSIRIYDLPSSPRNKMWSMGITGTGSIDSYNLRQTIMTEQELQQYLLSNFPKKNEGCEWKEFKNMKL